MGRLRDPSAGTRNQLLCGMFFWLVVVLAWLIFVPALYGTFIFDDFPNLDGLGLLARDSGLYGFIQYAQSGASGPLGRPIALATFALQHASWPQHPEDFIRINLLLHLLNGCLLWWWLLRWQRLAQPHGDRPVLLLTLAIAVLWLLAPMQANAVFYIVQRMTVLSATFVLLGLLLHTAGRSRATRAPPLTGYLLMTAGWAVGLGLGILTKESAALYPILVLAYESTLLRGVPQPRLWRLWSFAFLKLPALLLLSYLVWTAVTTDSTNPARPASWERFVIECRILFLYLYKLLIPPLYGTRLMYDDYLATAPHPDSWATLLFAAGWLSLLFVALRQRVAWPHFSFAVLWFFAAHLLESTVIPLELAFEHRNYLAIVGPLLFLATGFAWLLWQPWVGKAKAVLKGAAVAYVLFAATAMWQTAMLWGSPEELALFWNARQPESRRALQHAANSLLLLGETGKGRQKFEEGMSRWPRDPTLPLGLLQAGCSLRDLPLPDIQQVAATLRDSDGHSLTVIHMLDGLMRHVEAGSCERVSAQQLERLCEAALESPALGGLERFTLLLRARSAALAGDREAALHHLDGAIRASPRVGLLREGIVLALQADKVARARAYLEIAETGAGIPRLERWSQREEIAGMRQLIDLYEAVSSHEPGA